MYKVIYRDYNSRLQTVLVNCGTFKRTLALALEHMGDVDDTVIVAIMPFRGPEIISGICNSYNLKDAMLQWTCNIEDVT